MTAKLTNSQQSVYDQIPKNEGLTARTINNKINGRSLLGSTTHRIAPQLKALVKKGLITKEKQPNGKNLYRRK